MPASRSLDRWCDSVDAAKGNLLWELPIKTPFEQNSVTPLIAGDLVIYAGLENPKIKARLAELGSLLMPMSRAEFGKLIADESAKWAKVVATAGIKAD